VAIDWREIFVPQHSIVELIVRGSIMYLMLFLLLRTVIRRRVGAFSLTDLLLIVLIADAAQHGMAGEYKSITEGLVLCATIVGWSVFLDWLAYHSKVARDWLEPPQKSLVVNGRVIPRHMREELITKDELMSQLREHGVEKLGEVKHAYIEPDGQISVVKVSGDSPDSPKSTRRLL